MTTQESEKPQDKAKDTTQYSEKMSQNLEKIEALSQRLVSALTHKKPVNTALEGPGQDLMMKASAAYMTEMMQNPGKLIEQQVGYWGKALKHYVDAQSALTSGKLTAPQDTGPKDRRFANPLWDTHPYFNFIKQQYLLNAQTVRESLAGIEALEGEDRKRVDFFAQQIVDMMAPTNFLATNPDALEKAVETEGASLVQGLENLVTDVETNAGDLLVTLADKDAFEVGRNIGMTEGAVVFRNHMFELIQYAPTTKEVHEIPLVIFPPWINKFYILDLKEKNSLIKWVVDQGFTLFVVSWVNPDASYADVGMIDYIEHGFERAFEVVKEITNQPKVNAVGYCIAGTTLSLTLSKMKQAGEVPVNAATFFTTMTDFSDRGEVGVFLDNDFVDGIEAQIQRDGVLDSYFMSRTFSYLRSNDLIYTPAIKSYMLGEAPPAFDLLYWNGDSTNLPGKMAVEYLRGLCQQDRFASGEGFEVSGHVLHLSEVDVPLCAIACETDHIAAAASSYRGVQKMGSTDKTFILSQSGHIAGIVNPPSKKKYGHYINTELSLDFEDWKAGADFDPISWWPRWKDWLEKQSGAVIPARKLGTKSYPILENAPGTYVKPQKSA
ncbi:PHA/PHB synthase family protein [Algirhabdus cladophorae]|uniref:PHA/PHB synthase family protein n=1 Tax=Algirhabdus cladophorae TaxID=3377108 RepID=UPI003B849D66